MKWSVALLLIIFYVATSPRNHTEAEDVYDFARLVEQGSFAEQAGVNRMLALPAYGLAYQSAGAMGYEGRAFPFMIFINRLLGVGCVILFWKILQAVFHSIARGARGMGCNGQPVAGTDGAGEPDVSGGDDPGYSKTQTSSIQLPTALLLAFSYGFWRYVNEAETYMLAAVFLLSAWLLVLRGKWILASVVSGVGVLVHLLNVVPLLLVIPAFYVLDSKNWKRAVAHGLIAGLLVAVGYAACASVLDWSELGARHHGTEAGMGLKNILRGGIAFGQNLVSGNFLFGFEAFRDRLSDLFPSRMLDEECFMGVTMSRWIPWAGMVTLVGVGVFLVAALRPKKVDARIAPFWWSCVIWLVLMAFAVIRTEAGSPELWILALIPFWLVMAPFLDHRVASIAVVALLGHNLIAGLLPVLSEKTDYHAAKSAWLVDNAVAEDVVLTSYEPVLIFYMSYHCPAKLMCSSDLDVDELKRILGDTSGHVYAFNNFFEPLIAMRARYPKLYERMCERGAVFEDEFDLLHEDEFGGVFVWKSEDVE